MKNDQVLNLDSRNREEGVGWVIDQKGGMRWCFQIKLGNGVDRWWGISETEFVGREVGFGGR